MQLDYLIKKNKYLIIISFTIILIILLLKVYYIKKRDIYESFADGLQIGDTGVIPAADVLNLDDLDCKPDGVGKYKCGWLKDYTTPPPTTVDPRRDAQEIIDKFAENTSSISNWIPTAVNNNNKVLKIQKTVSSPGNIDILVLNLYDNSKTSKNDS